MKDAKINLNAVLSFLRRFHFILFFILIALLLAAAILMLYSLVDKASGSDTVNIGSSSNFDQDTIERVKQLKTIDDPSEPLELSGGRIDPFNE
jgi:hypothetical protein